MQKNQYTWKPFIDKKSLENDYKTMSQVEIAKKYHTTQKIVYVCMRRFGIKRRIRAKRNQTGENNDSWKGGRASDGRYVFVRCEGHPKATKNGKYVFEHVLNAEKKIGRHLKKDEVVHHINFDIRDNRQKNLFVTTRSKHAILHNSLGYIIKPLLEKKIVRFDEKEGVYVLCKKYIS